MKIHHATAKKAKSLGIEITEKDGHFVLSYKDNKLLATDPKVGVATIAAWLDDGDDVFAEEPEWADEDEIASWDEEGDDEGEGEGKSIVKRRYKKMYRPNHHTNGDDLARELKAHLFEEDESGEMKLSVKKLQQFAKLNDCWVAEYKLLNPGQQRMNIGNRLRAKLRKGHEIVWG